MKYYELHARKTGSEIVERFLDDGRRFIKHVPFNAKILTTLKEQFKDKPINVELKGTWIVITKTGTVSEYEKAGKSMMKDGETLSVERLAEEEKKMLERAGYSVQYAVGETK